MNKTLFATLALIGLCGLAACNESGPPMGSEEADARHVEVLEAEIAAMEPASAEEVAAPVVEETPVEVLEIPFSDTPGSTLRYRNVGTVGNCNIYEVQVAERSYILAQNTYYSSSTDVTCQITPR